MSICEVSDRLLLDQKLLVDPEPWVGPETRKKFKNRQTVFNPEHHPPDKSLIFEYFSFWAPDLNKDCFQIKRRRQTFLPTGQGYANICLTNVEAANFFFFKLILFFTEMKLQSSRCVWPCGRFEAEKLAAVLITFRYQTFSLFFWLCLFFMYL